MTLYWDSHAEDSYDRFLKRKDFQGYMIYRSTEYAFNDINLITDTYGSTKYYIPIAQFDKIDGIKGFHTSDIAGVQFYLGDDTGLSHVWTDTTVQNGQTYYYAVVSYDEGDTLLGGGKGLAPTPCPSIIDEDVAGNLRFDVNTAAAIPQAPSAGYIPPRVGNLEHLAGDGSGYIEVEIVDPRLVKEDYTYQVAFESDTTDTSGTRSYSVYDVTSASVDTLVQNCEAIELGQEGPLFDGMRIFVFNDTSGVALGTGDIFQFETSGAHVDQAEAASEMDDIRVVPNPYVAAASWEDPPLSAGLVGRGEREIHFIHLPQECTIRIFTISGFLVDTIHHDSSAETGDGTLKGEAKWNLVSKDGMDVAYGVYIYHVHAPGVGEKIGRFAVIK